MYSISLLVILIKSLAFVDYDCDFEISEDAFCRSVRAPMPLSFGNLFDRCGSEQSSEYP